MRTQFKIFAGIIALALVVPSATAQSSGVVRSESHPEQGRLMWYSEQEFTPEQRANAEEAIQTMRAQWEAWKNKDKTAFANILPPVSTYFGPWHPYLETHDRSTFLQMFDEVSNQFELKEYLVQQPLHVNIYGRVAVLAYNLEVFMATDKRPMNYSAKVSSIYVKQPDGTWRNVHAHESMNAPQGIKASTAKH